MVPDLALNQTRDIPVPFSTKIWVHTVCGFVLEPDPLLTVTQVWWFLRLTPDAVLAWSVC